MSDRGRCGTCCVSCGLFCRRANSFTDGINQNNCLMDNSGNIVQMQPPMIEAIIETGVDWNSAIQVIERRLIETGVNYENADDLINAVLTLEQNSGTNNILQHPDYEADYIAAIALEENQGNDFILRDTTLSPPSDTYTSNHQVDTELLCADMQQPIVLAVLDTGVDRNIVEIVIERRLRETGDNFHNVQELMDAVLTFESNTGSSNIPQSISRLRVPLDTSPGNVSFRTQATKLAEENRQLRQQKDCKICFNSEMGVVFLPCGHLCCCQTCASGVPHCPVCRANINSRVPVFIS